jgi:hypothetical protein
MRHARRGDFAQLRGIPCKRGLRQQSYAQKSNRHIDLMPFLAGKEEKSPREGLIYWSNDGDCMAMRMGRFKTVFAEQRSKGLDVWREPRSPMRIPKFFDLRADPSERGEESFKYNDWFVENVPSIRCTTIPHEVARELQGVPAARQGGNLHDRPSGREDDAEGVIVKPWAARVMKR